MGWIKRVLVVMVVAWMANMVSKMLKEPPLPVLDPNPWWGPGEPQPEDISINRFEINFSEKDVKDLEARLALPLRLTPPLEDSKFTYGMNSEALQKIIHYWRHDYDWRKREAKLNLYPHFKTRIEGLDVHFMRGNAKVGSAKNVKVLPLLLIHGWPGSFVEFYDILPYLTTPQKNSNVVFDVICPSIPGYGFSEGSAKQGFSLLETAQMFLKLMKRLGYDQFYVQGGDWGSVISSNMATMYPKHILGVHVNMMSSNTVGTMLKLIAGTILPAGTVVDKKDEKKLYPFWKHFSMIVRETGYMHIQATKPDTIGGYSQTVKFTGSITTSVRYYAENINRKAYTRKLDDIPCRVPAGLAAFPQELMTQPKNFAAHKFYDIVSYSDLPVGGHFAALERPTLLAADIHQFVNAVEKRSKVM
ncbi:juvenile hormone epoxide hydrolase 1-like [Panulirus ornatus]|uniref:juvenile hormone epoxide hydrolase 1-like n=1 Tax=Panulirus ornatus TaxID=150431 RepID=UPI003A8866D7